MPPETIDKNRLIEKLRKLRSEIYDEAHEYNLISSGAQAGILTYLINAIESGELE